MLILVLARTVVTLPSWAGLVRVRSHPGILLSSEKKVLYAPPVFLCPSLAPRIPKGNDLYIDYFLNAKVSVKKYFLMEPSGENRVIRNTMLNLFY